MINVLDPQLLPTAEEVNAYRETGYYISRPLFTDAELEAAIAASERYYASLSQQRIDLPTGKHYDLAWWPEVGADKLRKNDYSTLVVPELAALRDKPILGAIAALLAGEDVRLWHDQLLYKPPVSDPDSPPAVGWHTDHGYWKTCSSDNLLTAWVPFTAMGEDIGSIGFVDGSLHWPDNSHLDFFSSDLDALEARFDSGGRPVKKTVALLKRGQVTFHHCRTIHGSGPNFSPGPRRSIALHMQPASNRYSRRYINGNLCAHSNDTLTAGAEGYPDYADAVFCPVLGRVDAAKKALGPT
jgi:ectoine hydroxylase-related dioxygenase (phytanoyl-CoA dioxygenase family)